MENTNIFGRIVQLYESQGYKNMTDFAKNGLNYKSPQKLLRLKDINNKPSMDIIMDISNKFESINLMWLIGGVGGMFIDSDDDTMPINLASEPKTKYSLSESPNNLIVETQQKLITSLEKQIEHLEEKLRVVQTQLEVSTAKLPTPSTQKVP